MIYNCFIVLTVTSASTNGGYGPILEIIAHQDLTFSFGFFDSVVILPIVLNGSCVNDYITSETICLPSADHRLLIFNLTSVVPYFTARSIHQLTTSVRCHGENNTDYKIYWRGAYLFGTDLVNNPLTDPPIFSANSTYKSWLSETLSYKNIRVEVSRENDKLCTGRFAVNRNKLTLNLNSAVDIPGVTVSIMLPNNIIPLSLSQNGNFTVINDFQYTTLNMNRSLYTSYYETLIYPGNSKSNFISFLIKIL